jgi:hypothetical protein
MCESLDRSQSGANRRQLFRTASALGAACFAGPSGLALPGIAFAQAQESGPVDCGPPPPAKAQGRTGGESFPPLPLPVTPLRRT